jgi:hypothetical protein
MDPRQPDVLLLCKDGETVPAHSCLLMLASEPLMPAIKMAMEESVPEGRPCKRSATSFASGCHAGEAGSIKVEDDDADAWELALQFLDVNRVQRPEVTWVSA